MPFHLDFGFEAHRSFRRDPDLRRKVLAGRRAWYRGGFDTCAARERQGRVAKGSKVVAPVLARTVAEKTGRDKPINGTAATPCGAFPLFCCRNANLSLHDRAIPRVNGGRLSPRGRRMIRSLDMRARPVLLPADRSDHMEPCHHWLPTKIPGCGSGLWFIKPLVYARTVRIHRAPTTYSDDIEDDSFMKAKLNREYQKLDDSLVVREFPFKNAEPAHCVATGALQGLSKASSPVKTNEDLLTSTNNLCGQEL